MLRKLRDLRTELNGGMPIPDDRLTVAGFLDRWLTASLPGQVSDKTLDSYTDTVRLHLKPSLGRKVLRKLTVSDVDQLLSGSATPATAPTRSASFELYFAAL